MRIEIYTSGLPPIKIDLDCVLQVFIDGKEVFDVFEQPAGPVDDRQLQIDDINFQVGTDDSSSGSDQQVVEVHNV